MSAIIIQFGARTEQAKAAVSNLASVVASSGGQITQSLAASAALTGRYLNSIGVDYQKVAGTVQKAGIAMALANGDLGQAAGIAALSLGRLIVQYRTLLLTTAALGVGVALASGNLSELVSIGDKAAAVKLSPETFQAFIREAERARIATKEAEAALASFARANKGGFDAANEKNPTQASPLGKLLQDLVLVQRQLENSPALDRFLNAEDQNARLRATIDIIRELQKAQQDLAATKVAETAFGAQGEKFAEQIRQGRFALEELVSEGKAAGLVFDNDLVARAVELRNRLEAAAREIGDNLTPLLRGSVTVAEALGTAFVGAAEAAAAVTSAVAGIVRAIADAVAGAAQLVRTLGQTPEGIAGLEAKAQRRRNLDRAIREDSAGQEGALSPIEAARVKLGAGLGQPLGQEPSDFGRNVNRRLGGSGDNGAGNVIVPLPPSRPDNLGQGRGRGGGKSETDERLETVKAYIESLEKVNRLLQAEVETFGKGNVEREKAIALAKLSVDATEAEKQKILQVAESTGVYRDRLAELERQQRQNAEAARFFGDAAVDAITDLVLEGEKASKVFENLGKSILRSALQGLLTGQGPFAGIFGGSKGGLLGGLFSAFSGRAGGGSVFGGTPYMVGEQGPELFLPGQSGTIVPNDALRRSGGGETSVTFVINAPGADAAQLQAVQMELRQLKLGFRQNVAGAMRELQLRGVRP